MDRKASRRAGTALLLWVALGLTACHKKAPKPAPVPEQAQAQGQAQGQPAASGSIFNTAGVADQIDENRGPAANANAQAICLRRQSYLCTKKGGTQEQCDREAQAKCKDDGPARAADAVPTE